MPLSHADYLTQLDGSSPSSWPHRVQSPGRINLIGEHVDYTGGLVLPAAIDRGIRFLARPLERAEWMLHALDIEQTFSLPLPITGRSGELWVDYLAGIGVQFQDQGHILPGLEIVFGGDLPRGSGMSSSAALEGGMAFLLNELTNAGLSRPALAQLCKRSSNTFLHIPCGIMDQYASLNGRASGPIVLNCHTLESEPVKNNVVGFSFLLINSMVSHDLSDGAYAKRVEECATALAVIRGQYPDVDHLSAVTAEQLRAVRQGLDPIAAKRAAYVIAENERVRRAINALEAGSDREFGQLLNGTHAGLRDEYEVSCGEIDFLQRTATAQEGVVGARIMGGGFGGCTINLMRTDRIPKVQSAVAEAYRAEYGIRPEFYPVHIADGTHLI